MAAFLLSGGMHGNPEPEGLRDIIGPTLPRGTTNGLIVRGTSTGTYSAIPHPTLITPCDITGGRIVAEWGDTERVDMTFSATKSYLSTVVGLAWGDGLLALDDKIGSSVKDGALDGPVPATLVSKCKRIILAQGTSPASKYDTRCPPSNAHFLQQFQMSLWCRWL